MLRDQMKWQRDVETVVEFLFHPGPARGSNPLPEDSQERCGSLAGLEPQTTWGVVTLRRYGTGLYNRNPLEL